jgi:hypothetical protein
VIERLVNLPIWVTAGAYGLILAVLNILVGRDPLLGFGIGAGSIMVGYFVAKLL